MTTDTSGIILINKSAGITSFKALGSLKKSLKEYSGKKVKVGHTGTLDSFAEGLLVVLAGKFTRLNPVFTAFDKSYEAEIVFGAQTNTLDPNGEVINTCDIPSIEEIENNIPDFTGLIKQRPPIFSAIHIEGERAYKKALEGSISELPEREVRIDTFDVINWAPPVLKCRIACSKGTYIRSIARDLGLAAGSCAHLGALKRLSVGPFIIDDSVTAVNFSPDSHLIRGRDVFIKLSKTIPEMFDILEIKPEKIEFVKFGAEIKDQFFIDPPKNRGSFAIFSKENFIAYINYNSGKYTYNFVG